MKQLLVWCGEKAMDGQQVGRRDKVDDQVLELVKCIEEAVLGGIVKGQIDCSWYMRQRDTFEEVQVTKPHPRNVANLARMKEFEATIARLTKEEGDWVSCLQERNETHAKAVDTYPSTTRLRNVDRGDLDLSGLQEKELEVVKYAHELDSHAPVVVTESAVEDVEVQVRCIGWQLIFLGPRAARCFG